MDWKYKHFHREGVFQAPRDEVFQATQAFLAESLGWRMVMTAEGFRAKGKIGATMRYDAATANFRIKAAPDGTKVDVELLVDRWLTGPSLWLFNAFGYYDGQILNWLQGIQRNLPQGPTSGTGSLTVDGVPANGVQWTVHQRLGSATQPTMQQRKPAALKASTPEDRKPGAPETAFSKRLRRLAFVALCFPFIILALVGLITGHLYLPGGRHGDYWSHEHGPWARIVSAAILMVAVFFVWKIRKADEHER